MDRATPKKIAYWSGRTVPKFCTQRPLFRTKIRSGKKNRLKNHFWLTQSKDKFGPDQARLRAKKLCSKPVQKAGRANNDQL